ncbi:MAG: DUF4367 domain-containing protein [Hespellia sp.]|nr:DUF4367 domain-containing protein [Hespellia sp.]
MKEYKEISIVDEMDREAEDVRKEIEANEKVRDARVTPEMDARMEARIKALEEQLEKESAKKKVRKFPRKKKVWIALVAVLVLLLAVGTTSVGSKSYLKEMWDKRFGNNDVDVTSVADMESSELKEIDDMSVYREIKEKLGFTPVKLSILPYGMKLDDYEIDEDAGMAKIFYLYQGETIQYKIYASNTDSSYGKHPTDQLEDKFSVDNGTQSIDVEEYRIEGAKEKRLYAEFDDKDVKYQLKGIMNRSDFEELLNNLKYF